MYAEKKERTDFVPKHTITTPPDIGNKPKDGPSYDEPSVGDDEYEEEFE